MAHLLSEIPTTVAHRSIIRSAMISPAFPAHWIMTFFPCIFVSRASQISSSTYAHPVAVAAHLPLDPPVVSGFPVNDPGENVPTSLEYSSIIHAMILGLVLTSGAGTSVFGPIYL